MKALSRERHYIENCGGYTGKDFKSFARRFHNKIKKLVKEIGGDNVETSTGHYILSGFFDLNGKTYYYSLDDVRYSPDEKMLIREAEHHKDYRGKTNYMIELSNTMLKDFFRK